MVQFDLSQLPPPAQETFLKGSLLPSLQTQGADGEVTGDEDEPSIKDPQLGKLSSNGAAKGKRKYTVPVSEDDEIDLDFLTGAGSQELPQTPGPLGAQKSQGIEPSPWRRHVGVCEEGVYFPPVF